MVFVLNKNKKPLHTCHPARANYLLKTKQAAVNKRYPFTIRMKRMVDTSHNKQTYRIKIDPGSKTTGLAILKHNEVVFCAEIHHKNDIKKKLDDRRSYRRGRRNRNTRYRKERFLNRTREQGWLPPSLLSRVDNITSWVRKLSKLVPITDVSMELVRFDLQKLKNPEISGIEYQQGTLMGYEVREYLLEKWGRKCAYCEETNMALEVEHFIAKDRGGSNRIHNLAMACRTCNEDKDNLLPHEWMLKCTKRNNKKDKIRLKNIPLVEKQLKKPLKDATVVNATRWKLYHELTSLGFEVEVGSGGRTKMQRIGLNLPKAHYYDACCVGSSTPEVLKIKTNHVLQIKAKGRGSRYRSGTNQYGFPVRFMPRTKTICGYISGDMVKANIPKGKYKGVHVGTISMRSSGYADIKDTNGKRIAQGVNSQNCQILQRFDGYGYQIQKRII